MALLLLTATPPALSVACVSVANVAFFPQHWACFEHSRGFLGFSEITRLILVISSHCIIHLPHPLTHSVSARCGIRFNWFGRSAELWLLAQRAA